MIDDEKVYGSVKKGLNDFGKYILHVRDFMKRSRA